MWTPTARRSLTTGHGYFRGGRAEDWVAHKVERRWDDKSCDDRVLGSGMLTAMSSPGEGEGRWWQVGDRDGQVGLES